MTEQWRRVPGHPNHIVSDLGRVRQSRVNAPIMKGYIDADGYCRVRLDGKERRVHRLVCEAFHGPPPEGTECAHTDHQKTNNRADNLRWATHADNIADTISAGRFPYRSFPSGERHPSAKLSVQQVAEVHAGYAAGLSQRSLARKFGVSQPRICRILKGSPKDIAPPSPHPHKDRDQ